MLQGVRRSSLLVVFIALFGLAAIPASPGGADVIQQHGNARADGWYPDQTNLSSVVQPNGTFGKLFEANVDGQVYAQPLISNGKVLVATENAKAYAFDKTGDGSAAAWSVNLGNPWKAADLGCADLTPNIGVTGTPAIDPATNTEYLVAKTYVSGNSGPAIQKLHALDITTGTERPGFPVVIQGAAQNAANVVFPPTTQLQRPGLLLMNGVVYIAFGGHCDHPPYYGWVFGVGAYNATNVAQIVARWTVHQTGDWGGGIWQAGGALLSDKPGDILLATGNGALTMNGPTVGSTPPKNLAESVVRLRVQPDQSLKAVDFFTPYDAPELDLRDADFGSGGPVLLPSSYNGTPLFGTPQHPNLIMQEGKAGYVHVLDADNLGGYREGPNGGDAAVARLGPYGGVWSTATAWPGDGGYVYIVHGSGGPVGGTGYFRAYKYGVDGSGNPTFALAANSADGFGFGSGTPIVTSDGLTSGSALVWTIRSDNGAGANAQLRAYDPVPVNGQMHLRWSAPIGTAVKFGTPAVSDNRVYVGTRDGKVLGFGSPVNRPFDASVPTMNFDRVVLNQQKQSSVTLTATRSLDITKAPTVTGTGFSMLPLDDDENTFPLHVDAGEEFEIPVVFKPTTKGLASATISVPITGESPFLLSTLGVGQVAGGDIAAYPDQISIGGAAVGRTPTTQTVTFTNNGASPLHIISRSVPGATTWMTVTGLPPDGSVLNPGQSVIATVTFAPKAEGFVAGNLIIRTDATAPGVAQVNVPITATGAAPPSLEITPLNSYFGAVRIGTTQTRYVRVFNNGGTSVTITKSKPPAAGNGFFVAPFSGMDEGFTIGPHRVKTIGVSFTPFIEHAVRDYWIINSDDGSGVKTLRFDGFGAKHKVGYWMADTNGRVYQFGDLGTSALATPPPTRNALVAIVPSPSRLGYVTLDARGRVQKAGDGVYVGSLPANALRPFESAVSLSVTASGRGYWIFTSFGRVFRFGDAPFLGDLASTRLTKPIVSSVATPSGAGYYMVAGDGGVFTFGDAKFYGSTGGLRLKAPVVGIVPTPTGFGYWLVASDGGIFAFGDAPFRGSMGAKKLTKPVVGMISQGNGYMMVASDGGIFNFSNQVFVGSLGGRAIPAPIAAVGSFTI
jgi:iron transport multicopper oxidase